MQSRHLLAFSLSLILCASYAAAAKEYELPGAIVHYTLHPDGSIDASQQVTYKFTSGAFTELYIRLPPDLEISNEGGNCEKKSCAFRTQMNEGWQELVLSAPYSEGETETATFRYKIEGEILQQKDASQFFFKLWGDQWAKPVGNLKAEVEFPGDVSQIAHYVHPYGIQADVSSRKNTLAIVSTNHPEMTFLELNAVMPTNWFGTLPTARNFESRDEIISGEEKEKQGDVDKRQLGLFVGFLLLALWPASLAWIYHKFGREIPLEQLGYNAIYEREPPTKLSPTAASNLISKGGYFDWIAAETLNLATIKAIGFESARPEAGKQVKDGELTLIMRKKSSEIPSLEPHQKKLLDYYWLISEKGVITPERMQEVSNKSTYAQAFNPVANAIFDCSGYMSKLVEIKREGIILAFVWWFVSSLILALAPSTYLRPFFIVPDIFSTIFTILTIAGFAILFFKPTLYYKWTPEGRLLKAKWKNFFKFLDNMTLMEEKAPADLILWDHYLVYATAFGISDKVSKAMGEKFPDATDDSEVYRHMGSFKSFRHNVSALSSKAELARGSRGRGGHGGGGHGSGGGGGGGGGGAR